MPIRFSMSANYHTGNAQRQIERGLQANLKAAAMIWHGGVIRLLRGGRSGATYKIPGTMRYYQASAPGEAPATRLGDLRTSYRFIVQTSEAAVGSPLDYALWLEKGTSKMAPRPHLQPAYQQNKGRIHAALEANVI